MLIRKPVKISLDHIETISVDELRAIQFDRLTRTISRTYANVERFRQKCLDKGIEPSDFKDINDLCCFPFTDKEDLRISYPFGMLAVPVDSVARIHASSGTTGKPTIVAYTKNDIETWATVCARSIRAAGGTSSDKVHVAYGYGLFTGGLGAHYGAEKLGAMVIPMSGGQTAKQVQMIMDIQPTIIMCTPSYMLNIADEFQRQGIDPASSPMRVGIFGAEPWGESMREQIEDRCGLDALDIYGLSEVIGPGVASECINEKSGPIIWEDHFYPEIVDPTTGEPLPDGELGELVFTSLTKEALPVIRYRTHDLTRLLPGNSRPMRRLDKIIGRSDDMLIIRGVNVFPTQIEERILQVRGLAPHYQLRVSRSGHLDRLTVLVEREPSISAGEVSRLARTLQAEIKTHIGVTTNVEVGEPGDIPRSEGKAVRTIDERVREN